MLLETLKNYFEELVPEEQTPPMYERQRVRYVVDLDADGRYLNVVDLATETTGQEARGPLLVGPKVARTVAIRANLMLDNVEYALGLAREKSPPAKVRQRHAAFVEQVRRCAADTG